PAETGNRYVANRVANVANSPDRVRRWSRFRPFREDRLSVADPLARDSGEGSSLRVRDAGRGAVRARRAVERPPPALGTAPARERATAARTAPSAGVATH